jgi:NAD(P)-dependent dehydrogenase (short-subunit alcohol dehydrogenase family)
MSDRTRVVGGYHDATEARLSYTREELLADHDYAAPQVEVGYRLHGGFDADGAYVSPRTLNRWPAVKAWQDQVTGRGFELIDASTRLLKRGNFPTYEQQALMLKSGIGKSLWNSLTVTGVIEARGRALCDITAPDFQKIVVEDISDTCTGHLNKGLLHAHGLDEGGDKEHGQGGHDDMWFAVRDMLFGKGAYPHPVIPESLARPEAGRRMPQIPPEYENWILLLMNVLMIEVRAESFFSYCIRLMRSLDLFTDRRAVADHAADLVDRIRTDEAIHVAYLQGGDVGASLLHLPHGGRWHDRRRLADRSGVARHDRVARDHQSGPFPRAGARGSLSPARRTCGRHPTARPFRFPGRATASFGSGRMTINLTGKTALVTGGASGLGLSMARAFGKEGMQVMLADIDEKALATARADLEARQVRVSTVVCDVTDRSGVRSAALKTIADFGKVHVVCNNAGVAVGGPIETLREKDWDWIVDVNLKGVVYGTETFAPLIKSHGEGGHFVNTASMAGMISPPGMEPYTATKFAVVAMSEGWAAQLAPSGIGVSVLCPGFVRTLIHESGRNRQAQYGGSGYVDPGVGPSREEAAANVLNGIDPDIVGRRVVEGIKNNDLYIFTHREMRAFVQARFERIMAGFDSADASEALSVLPKPDISELLKLMQAQAEQGQQ